MNGAERVARHPDIRVKVDLSRFFHDARQCCWIFVDGAKVQQVGHIEQHIAKLFGIPRPFHLLLNGSDYLPPTEDVRILEKNEMIQVVPGSGIDAVDISVTLSDINVHNDLAKVETGNSFVRDRRDVQSTDVNVIKALGKMVVSSNTSCDSASVILTNNTTTDAIFYSIIDDAEADTDSQTTDNCLMENCNNAENSVASGTKRRRVRKRRSRNQTQEHSLFFSPINDANEENKPKKPKIVDTYIIPSTKHIRFENAGNEENSIAKTIVQEVSRSDSYMNKDSSPGDLSALLALGNSSTPMFVKKKKPKNEVNTDSMLRDKTRKKSSSCKSKENNVCMEKSIICDIEAEARKGYYKNVELEKLPLMTRQPQIKDIIAFKTLKIGADYTPQLSGFIVTEVMDYCEQSKNYTVLVFEGKQEIQVPLGKFSLPEDENTCAADTFLLNHKQMKELRLIL